MDYDDNDFQSQNLHLAGEGSNKFPPVINPYALPKFEFDDNIHVPLRYDSLVETEVFLGIENNEDSQWIEDYSRGSNTIQFGSSAAESCCILRQNNVWSEATSSESVEMLLRSVGNEESFPLQASAKKSDACDELGCMINQMEPSSNQDSNLPIRPVDFADVQQTLQSADIAERFPTLNAEAGAQQPLDQGVSEGHDGNNCFENGLGDLTAVAAGAEFSVAVENEFIDGKCDSVGQSAGNTVIYESLAIRTVETVGSEVQVVDIVDTEDIGISNIRAENEDVLNQTTNPGDGIKHTVEIDTDDYKEERDVLNEAEIGVSQEISDATMVETGIKELQSPACSAPVENASEANISGSNLSNMEGPYTFRTETDLSENLESTDVSRGSESILLVHVDNRAQDGSGSVCPSLTDSFVTSSEVLPTSEEKDPSADGNESIDVSHAHDSSDYNILATKACKGIPPSFPAESPRGHEREIVSQQAESPHGHEREIVPQEAESPLGHERETVPREAESPQGHEREIAPQEDEDRGLRLDGLVQQNEGSESPSNGATVNNEVHNSLITDGNIGTLPSVGVDDKVMAAEYSVDLAAGDATARTVDPSIVKVSTVSALGSAQISEEEGRDIPISGLSEGTSAIVGCVLELEKGVSGASGEGLNSNVDESLSMVDECSQKDHIDSAAVSMNEDVLESSKETEECSIPPTSLQKEDNAVIVEETEEKASLKDQDNVSKQDASQKGRVEDEAALAIDTNDKRDSMTDRSDNVSKQDASQKGHVEDEAVLAIDTNDKQDSMTDRSECETTVADLEKQSVASSVVIPTTELSEAHPTEEINRYPHFTPSTPVDADKSFSHDSKKGTPSKDDGSFTFQVTPLTESPQVETRMKLQLMQTVEPSKVSMAMDVSPSTAGLSQLTELPQVENTNKLQLLHTVELSKVSLPMDASPSMPVLGQLDGKIVQDISHQSPKVSDVTIHQVGAKGNSERKPRRRVTPKESAKRVKTPKEITPAKMERGNKAIITPSSSVVAERAQSNEIQRYGPLVGTSMAGLPDLNSSVSSMVVFQQPFTDMQQVQLRAQIFAYGALIQGTAPEEAYMISAFGGPDGGKSAWEKPWRLFVERLNGHITHLNTPGTPVQSFSGARVPVPDQSSKQSTRKVKAGSSTGARSSSRAITPITSPTLPLSTPLWNVSTPSDHMQASSIARSPVLDFQRTLSPLPSHQPPAMRNLVAHNSWMSQGHFGPWMTSPQTSAVDTGSRFTVQMPHTEPLHLTPVKDSSLPLPSAMKHVSTPLVTYTDPSGNLLGNTSMPEVSKMVIASGQQSTIPKPRKRKKSSVPENTVNLSLLHQPSQEFVPSVAITTPVSFVPKPPAENLLPSTSPLTTNFRKADLFADQRVHSSEESLSLVKDARHHAEDAAALAATAISHSQELWSKLDKQKNAGLSPDVEAKLSSAAVAIAAASAVAKAAAAAAKVAADAALQARLMADEAVQTSVISFSDEMKDLGNATPATILRRDNGTSSSSSIILAARETARKRVEAASAASKRAENMDAIIRAAELAAEAVSQAGKIVAMGDPLPLSVLASTGPEGYWKDPQVSPQRVSKANELITVNLDVPSRGRDVPGDSSRSRAKEGLSSSQTGMPGGKEAKELKGPKYSETTLEVVLLDDGNGSKPPTTSETENIEAVGSSKESVIKEGSSVEILRDGNGFKAAWFSAKVLTLRDDLAYVSYDELTSGEGSEKLTEWVALRGEGAEAPKIRISRPVIALPYEGTRKRRRAAVNDYNWSVGDRVDAWLRESWWEGVVTEKNKKDDTHLTVYFPVQGETSVVRAWHLRPSLLWKDGEWMEWSNLQQKNVSFNTGDTPKQKRPRMQSPVVESKDEDKVSENPIVKESGKHDESTLLNLAAGEAVFNVGKATGDGSRTARTGLQKEGSKVVFGVPKPGKKRKFMEVSKHYVAGRIDRTNEANDPAKSAKYSTSQVSGPRGWRSTPKTDTAAEKRTTAAFAAPKSKLPKPGNRPHPSGRTFPQKETSSNSSGGPAFTDNSVKAKTGGGASSNTLEKESSMDRSFSSSGEATDPPPIVFSAVARRSDAIPSKKLSTTNARSVRGNKGKFAPAAGRLGKVEEGKVFSSAASSTSGQSSSANEPRRSVRRIQPTSRLLEGLQSSLMVSKIPYSVSHDKSHKSRPAFRGNNNNG